MLKQNVIITESNKENTRNLETPKEDLKDDKMTPNKDFLWDKSRDSRAMI